MRTLLIMSLLLLQGCYYGQAIRGQMELLNKREPIADLIADPSTPDALRERLERARAIRAFASVELGLPDNASYTTYADLGRPYAVWNVTATEEFSVQPVVWCFPFVGCVPYRGYFNEDAAHSFADQYRASGHDVRVGGVSAYSTLGWFSDPLLNTMLDRDEMALAAVIFHELAHQKLYVKGDTAFNEAFATVVEEEGVRRWLAAQGRADAISEYRARRARSERFSELLRATRDELRELFAGATAPEAMRESKAALYDALRARYRRVREEEWGGYTGYDRWFERALNNADLAAVGTYNDRAPALRELLASLDGDLAAFYRAAQDYAAPDRR
ncbi:MAG: aminopeptidase [Gammaproteobacteria bacterium]